MRYFTLLPAMLCVLCLGPMNGASAQDEAQTGHFQATFEERSPLSEKDKLGERIGLPPEQRKDYELSALKFDLYVPKDYKPDAGYGLIVYLASRETARPYPDWDKALDKQKLLWVGVPAFDQEAGIVQHLGSALDAAQHMTKQYKLDASRVYVAGIAGPMGASILGPHFPDVFGGGGLYMMGSRFFKAAKAPGEDGKQFPAEFRPPEAQTLANAKKTQRYVWITGATSTDLGPRDKAVFEAYKAEGFVKVDLFEIPEQGNVVPSPEWFEKGLARLEALKAGGAVADAGDAPNANDPNSAPNDPNNPPQPTVEATQPDPTPAKTGTFKTKFEHRSPLSEPRAFSRMWRIGRAGDDYDISKTSYQVYVPDDYELGKAYGLMVSLSSSSEFDDGQILHPDWRSVCDKQRLIWVGAGGAGPTDEPHKRLGLALDAVANIRMQYTIDDDRIYTVGLGDGAVTACQLAIGYPDVFDGGLFLQGGGFYRDLIEDNRKLEAGFAPPPSNSMRDARLRSRLCFLAGSAGQLKDLVELIRVKGYESDGFRQVLSVTVDKLGNSVPGGVSFGKGIEALDKILAGSDRPLLSIASRLERAGRLGEAWVAYAKVVQRTEDDKRREQAEAALAKLRQQRDQRIVAAKQALADNKQGEAKTLLEALVKDFGQLATDEPARLLAALEDVRARPATASSRPNTTDAGAADAPPASVNPRVEALAQRKLENAQKLAERDVVLAYRELREIAERYAATQAGAAAKQAADAIWADDAKRQLITEREAGQLLALARRYIAANNVASARDKLTQVIDLYPDSTAADTAKKLLADLKD